MTKLLLLSLLISLNVFAEKNQSTVIYGEDDRNDVIEETNPLYLRLAESTIAQVCDNFIQEYDEEHIVLKGNTLASRGICQDEKFVNQPAVGNCSGFFVAQNKIATAGHCVRVRCGEYSWVVGYKMNFRGQEEIIIPKKNVFKNKNIVSVENNARLEDYAVIELDGVADVKPLKWRVKGKVSVGDELVVIGHPWGLPTKIADNAKIRSVNDIFFKANLDTFQSNSGSAVFNSKTGLVEGILVRGENDFAPGKGCTAVNKIADDKGTGESVTLITIVKGLP